jgi:YD repeat-containing protein
MNCLLSWQVQCPPGTKPGYGSNTPVGGRGSRAQGGVGQKATPRVMSPLSDANSLVNNWGEQLTPAFMKPGLGFLNPSNGNLIVPLALPMGGAFDPTPVLVYNAQSTTSGEFGNGWTAIPKQVLTSLSSSTVAITDGTGAAVTFNGMNSSNLYQSPTVGMDQLAFNPANSTWTQTQPDGFQFHYTPSGQMDHAANLAGIRWTLTYNTGGLITKITDPFGNRTSWSYNASSYLKRIQDPAGRITSFTVNASGNLTRSTAPDGTITSLIYDSSNRLTAYIDPKSNRTTYAYNTSNQVTSIAPPTGGRVSYSYTNSTASTVTDTLGKVTTLLYNATLNIAGVIPPAGNRSTYVWLNNRVQS